jgi:hypothetical protein
MMSGTPYAAHHLQERRDLAGFLLVGGLREHPVELGVFVLGHVFGEDVVGQV